MKNKRLVKFISLILITIITFSFSYIYFPSFSETITYNSGDVEITRSGDYEIQNGVTSVKIVGNIKVNLVLNGVTINTANPNTGKPPVWVTEGATANIILVGENELTAGNTTDTYDYWRSTTSTKKVKYGYAGLQVDKDSSIIIRR